MKDTIGNLLSQAGYNEVKSDTETDVYGSVYCIYALGRKRFMIQWDSEEDFGSVEFWQSDNMWVTIEPIIVDESEQNFNNGLSELCQVINAKL